MPERMSGRKKKHTDLAVDLKDGVVIRVGLSVWLTFSNPKGKRPVLLIEAPADMPVSCDGVIVRATPNRGAKP